MLRILLMSLISATALAAGGGEHGIPWKMVLAQAFNVLLFIGILVYFLRAKIKSYYATKQESYLSEVNRAQKLKEEADIEKKELLEKMNQLNNNVEKELQAAQQKAQEIKASIEKQAVESANNLKAESKKSIDAELAKAKRELSETMLNLAIAETKKNFQEKANDSDQVKLINNFTSQLSEVKK